MNDALAASAAAGLALANDARSGGGGGGGGGGKSRNDVFFEWQRARFERGEAWALTDARANGGAWPRWLRLVRAEVARYAQASGAAEKVRGGAPAIAAAPLFAWAAVAGGGSPSTNSSSSSSGGRAGSAEGAAAGHLPHTHARAAVSGVYYARARGLRAGEGDLVLEDPRGALPPFGGRYRHVVREGDLVLFPGWLVHHVTPCCRYLLVIDDSSVFYLLATHSLLVSLSLLYLARAPPALAAAAGRSAWPWRLTWKGSGSPRRIFRCGCRWRMTQMHDAWYLGNYQ